jgi:hypothetical protein
MSVILVAAAVKFRTSSSLARVLAVDVLVDEWAWPATAPRLRVRFWVTSALGIDEQRIGINLHGTALALAS